MLAEKQAVNYEVSNLSYQDQKHILLGINYSHINTYMHIEPEGIHTHTYTIYKGKLM